MISRGIKSLVGLPIAAIVSLLVGCGVVFTTGRPGSFDEKADVYRYNAREQTALTYYLPKDVMEVIAQIEEQTSTNIVYPKTTGADGKEQPDKTKPPELEASTRARKLAAFDLAIVTVADRSKPFLIDAHSPGFYKNDSTINISETGLLESVNVKTTGAGGAVVQNVLKLAGTVLPFLQGAPALAAAPFALPSYASRPEGVSAFQSTLILRDPGAQSQQEAADHCSNAKKDTGIPDDEAAKTFAEQFFGERIELRYALWRLTDHRRLKREFCETLNTLNVRQGQLEDTTSDLAVARDPNAMRPLTQKLQAQRAELDRASVAHQAARDALSVAVAEKLVEDGVGTVKRTETRKFVLDLGDIPATPGVEAKSTARQPIAALEGLLTANTPAKELFDKTRTIVSIAALQTFGDGDASASSWAASRYETCKEACVYYREPILYTLKVWSARNVEPPAGQTGAFVQLQPPEERLLLLVSGTSPTRALDLPFNAWTKRDSAITFNARGRIVSLQRNSGAAAEEATAAVQQGLRAGITEYETSLTSIGTIDTLNQARALQPLKEQIAVAQQQLELIKAQSSLDVASSSTQALVDTQLATVEKNLVTAQQELIAAQMQLASATAADANSAESVAIAQANAALGAQIQQLKNEIDLMKLRKELSDLRSSTPP